MNKFYKIVSLKEIDGGYSLLLDDKEVKTPLQKRLLIPSLDLAEAIKAEWEKQEDKIIPASMPLFQLLNTVIDKIEIDPSEYIKQVLEYSKSDLVCYFAEEGDDIYPIEKKEWQPLIDWVQDRYNIKLELTNGINYIEQSDDTLNKFKEVMADLDKYQLASIQAAVPILGSIVISLAILENQMDVEQGFKAAFLDEIYQISKWGSHPETEKKHSDIISDLTDIYRFYEFVK